MNNQRLDIIRMICYLLIAFIFSLFSPWWIIAILGTFIGFHATSSFKAIFESMLILSITWFIMIFNNLFIQDYLIVEKMKDLLGLNSIVLIIITLMIPIVIGFLSSLLGYELKKAVRYEK